jgi:hypothetical protein
VTAHSRIGASSMHRWSVCPGSVAASKDIVSKSSKYAEEGSDAHALAAHCLKTKEDPSKFGFQTVTLEGRTFTVDKEMVNAVSEYVDNIYLDINPVTEDVLVVEQRFDLSEVHPGLFGTADAVTWKPRQKQLIVDDFKYGAGIAVDPENNPQLLYYGLGALLACNYPAATVTLRITQPRCDHAKGPVRWWTIDALDLLDFKADLKKYAQATEDPNAPLVPGDHCRFCPAAPHCKALRGQAQEIAKLEFAPTLAYDPADLKRALDSRDIVKAWLKTLDEFAYAEAEAGRPAPGYKLVAKRPTRKWRSEGEVIDHLQNDPINEYSPEQMFEPRALKSPAQLEKIVGKGKLDEFITSESSGHVLAPESDKRPAITRITAAQEFASSPVT